MSRDEKAWREQAERNVERHLRQNPYPGRGLVIGRAAREDTWLMIYWIMGRSAHSQNRRFVVEGTTLKTEPLNASLVDDPSLIIYEAMLELPDRYLISNGDQTRTLYETLQAGGSFDQALAQRAHEPDAPHYTPRISGMLSLEEPTGAITLNILKANALDPAFTDRFTYRPALPYPGFGAGLTTYQGDGNSLPSFQGEPLLLPCASSAEATLEYYWEALNPSYRISLAVKAIPTMGASSTILVKNRYL